MNREDIEELHCITPINNVPTIMTQGILCRNLAQKRYPNYSDISESGVQERRAKKKIPGINKSLHDYANLYFDAHNPMLCLRKSKNDEICVLKVNCSVLDIKGVIVTDKNAARECWFKTVGEGLPLLKKAEIFAKYWTRGDYWEQERLKGIKCAEVLVPGCVNPSFIFGAYVANDVALNKLCNSVNIGAIIEKKLFF